MARPKGSKDSAQRERMRRGMMSKKDIARHLKLNYKTVDAILHRAIYKLRQNPEALSEFVGLVNMRAQLHGPSRIVPGIFTDYNNELYFQ